MQIGEPREQNSGNESDDAADIDPFGQRYSSSTLYFIGVNLSVRIVGWIPCLSQALLDKKQCRKESATQEDIVPSPLPSSRS